MNVLIYPSTLKMGAILSSETSFNTTPTRCHIPNSCLLCRNFFYACLLAASVSLRFDNIMEPEKSQRLNKDGWADIVRIHSYATGYGYVTVQMKVNDSYIVGHVAIIRFHICMRYRLNPIIFIISSY